MSESRLARVGATARFAAALAALDQPELVIGRVTKALRKHCEVWTEAGDVTAAVPKRVFRSPAGAPVVGDFVAVDRSDPLDIRLAHVFERRTTLSRKAAGRATAQQIVAANVDTAFVIVGLDGDYNLRRIERYLAITWQGGVEPVVLLNKSDTRSNVSTFIEDVTRIASGAAVFAISAKHGHGLEALEAFLRPAQTVVLLGSSGAGKSTLVNRLLGTERMATGAVRARDDRGRHTTTHRELLPLAGGAVLIDTPGMRELGLLDHREGMAEAFSDIEALRIACRFADCRHESEPGCAIRTALLEGSLEQSRLASYLKLQGEMDIAARRRRTREQSVLDRAEARSKRRKKRT
jgi:ribosome biogenesis GTPase